MASPSDSTVCSQPRDGAIGPIRARANLAGLIATRVSLVSVTALAIVLARIGYLARVAIVGIDATQHATIDSYRVLYDDVAWPSIARAVATTADHLAVVFGVKVLDADGTAPVELEDLVLGLEGAATVDVGCP